MRTETRKLLPPPHSADAERAVLCSMLAYPEVIPLVVAVLTDTDFFVPSYRDFFEAMRRLHEQKSPVDGVTVMEQIKRHGDLDERSAQGTFAEILNGFGTKSGVETYARTVRDYGQRRQLLEVLRRSAQQVAEGDVNLSTIIEMQKEMLRVIEARQQDAQFSSAAMALEMLIQEITQKMNNPNAMLGLPMGWSIIDDWTGGMQAGEVYTIAALGGVGKTVAMLNIARHLAQGRWSDEQRKYVDIRRVGIFSTEMNKLQLLSRLVADVADIPAEKFRRKMDPYDFHRMVDYTEGIKQWPLIIDDTKGITRTEFRKRARQMVRNDGAEIVMLDYIQNLSKDDPGEDLFSHIESCSRITDELSEELGVPVVQLAQVNFKKTGGREPNKGSLEGGDSIYQDSDFVMFLHSPHVEGVNYQESGGRYAHLWIVDKNRHGRTGRINMEFESKYLRFLQAPEQGFSTKGK